MLSILRVLLALLLGGAAAVALTTPAQAAPTLSVSHTSVISGETIRFAGKLGTQPPRRVVLQRKAGNRWQQVAATTTTARGAFTFNVRLTGAAGTSRTFRAQAQRQASRPTVTTAPRTVRFVAQSGTLAAPATAVTEDEITVIATFRPARKGRTTVVERRIGDTWSEVAGGVQNRRGRTAFPLTLESPGDAVLRAVTEASGGARLHASGEQTVSVLPPVVQRMSESGDGVGGDGGSYFPAVSGDGRYVAFTSVATNLVPGDTNGFSDVFVRDRLTAAIERVSISDTEQQAASGGEAPSISADGRYVAFQSTSQLTSDPNSSTGNIFVRDRVAGTTIKISVPKPGDLVATNNSYLPSVSADGRSVAFVSLATNLVPGDTNSAADVFLRDIDAGTTVRVSTDNDGGQSNGASGWPEISADGQFVTYESVATNLVSDDTNGVSDVFWWPRSSGSTLRVSQTSESVGGNGASTLPSISGDGRYVAFQSHSTNLVGGVDAPGRDVLRWDRQTGTLDRVSVSDSEQPPNFDTGGASISVDGQQVLFTAFDVLAPGDTNATIDVYLRNIALGTTRRVSDTLAGGPSNGATDFGVLSADGRTAAFSSQATNLVPGTDSNAALDVFARDLSR